MWDNLNLDGISIKWFNAAAIEAYKDDTNMKQTTH